MAGSDMAQRIKELRMERNMTLEDVAKIVGVGKSTVRKWETGMIANMKRDKIASLAKALGTTPAYLMGWEEDKEDAPTGPKLIEGEEMLLKLFRKLPQEAQNSYIERLEEALKTLGLI
jgi:transcriptional regulator with XRE-family HTH domain